MQGREAQHATAARALVSTPPPAVATANLTYQCPGNSDDDGEKRYRKTIDALPATTAICSPVKIKRLGVRTVCDASRLNKCLSG